MTTQDYWQPFGSAMTPLYQELWQKIQTFSLDLPGTSLPLSRRLARDHQWSYSFTQRAIGEYKKFLFLAVATGHSVTPSEVVDAVWHCHLTYTESYWYELCGQVLEMPLHHRPTRGGSDQRALFFQIYERTLADYATFFGQYPPVDIWPAPAARFSPDSQTRHVSLQDYWLVPKPSWIGALRLDRFSLGRSSMGLWQSIALVLIASAMLTLARGLPLRAIAPEPAIVPAPSEVRSPSIPGLIAPPPDILDDGASLDPLPKDMNALSYLVLLVRRIVGAILLLVPLTLGTGLFFSYVSDSFQRSKQRPSQRYSLPRLPTSQNASLGDGGSPSNDSNLPPGFPDPNDNNSWDSGCACCI
jgi:hypothetical protein